MSDPTKQMKTMSMVCLILGPMMIILALVTHGALRLYDYAVEQQLPMETLGGTTDLLFGFARSSFPWMLGLGVTFGVTGFIGRGGGQRGRKSLVVAGWIGTVGMVALTLLWVLEVHRLDMHWLWHVIGVVLHGVQLVAMIRGLLYLMSEKAIRAADGVAPQP
ncbi:MAG: hypothetical protein RMA76_07015 [Deltaproteobacteria bacterium]|jgi:hypothetical protein